MGDLSKGSSNLLDRFNKPQNKNNDGKVSNTFGMKNVHGDNNIRNLSLFELIEAPKEWNFYRPLDDDKMMELIESIEKNGLLHPIVVWERTDDEYMILAGHNRAKAFKYLFEMDNGQKYRKIPALIKKKDEITEEDAWEIIIDTNWVQRSLSAVEKSNAKKEKYGSLNISKNGLVNNFEEKEIKRNINIEVPASVMGKYKNMSRSEKLLISQKLEKIIRKF